MKPTKPISYPLPECTIEPNASTELFTDMPAAKTPFHPTWLNIPREISRDLLVTDIKIDKNSQIINAACLPASLFATEGYLLMDEIRPGLPLRVSLTNTSKHPIHFRGKITGMHSIPADAPARKYICGLGLQVVNNQLNINVQPLVDFVPDQLYVPPHVLRRVSVLKMYSRPYNHGYLDKNGQHTSPTNIETASVPSPMLSTKNLLDSGRIELRPLSRVNISCWIVLELSTREKTPQKFSGAILGLPTRN